ncbi:hypothetical protein AC578_4808 [Pseudocercospora eumusae]|uniref:Glycoside hydrolase family 127 protein n=1 Tax=Pseudocercospora eumusae TaxID=321146 RepID=A0A139HLE0_9PEZI|nr:hypothetical protein AC578_4808 [Pseudocercospora eumusae]
MPQHMMMESERPSTEPASFDAASIIISEGHRAHPQDTYVQTTFDPESFYGRLRQLYADRVLKTQLDQLKKQGSYYAFNLKWNPKYDIGRLHGGKCAVLKIARPLTGSPISLFWDSDVAKWIEAACYFLSTPEGQGSPHREEFKLAVDELIGMMAKAQTSDGYLGTYFTVVDRKGRLQNLRDMHEMYCCGHLLEAALAHHQYSRSTKFLDVMIRYVALLMQMFGPHSDQRHGYPGHPELELALVRLYSRTRDEKHLRFARYLVGTRGVIEPDLGNRAFFVWEAEQRQDDYYHRTMESITDGRYHQWHAPLTEQQAVVGHAVRSMYLLTAAADLGDEFLHSAKRLWHDAVDNKMYSTGGIGSDPSIEGFSEVPHFLPDCEDEGGCYAETCASIGLCMLSERFLGHRLDGRIRDVMERSLLNTVLGGGSLDGTRFFYANPLATTKSGNTARSDWFDCCCCPPNLCRTLGLLGGYTWSADVVEKTINLDIYMYLSANRRIPLPSSGREEALVSMKSEMPWSGTTTLTFSAPVHWQWNINLPVPGYADNFSVDGVQVRGEIPTGFHTLSLPAEAKLVIDFDLPIILESPHQDTHKDTLTVIRGPLVYTAESWDNSALIRRCSGFQNIGLPETAHFEQALVDIGGHQMLSLTTRDAHVLEREGKDDIGSAKIVAGRLGSRARVWRTVGEPLTMIPFFARCNRQNSQQLRTSFQRVAESDRG